MAIVLVNRDNSVCFIGDELPEGLDLDAMGVESFDVEGSAKDAQRNIPHEYCVFDREKGKVEDDRRKPDLVRDPTFDALPDDKKAKRVRDIRKTKLRKMDTLVSNPLYFESASKEKIEYIKEYRQKLLDITDQATFPHSVEWPVPPEELK